MYNTCTIFVRLPIVHILYNYCTYIVQRPELVGRKSGPKVVGNAKMSLGEWEKWNTDGSFLPLMPHLVTMQVDMCSIRVVDNFFLLKILTIRNCLVSLNFEVCLRCLRKPKSFKHIKLKI